MPDLEQLVGTQIEHVDQVAALPVGSVLLCAEQEIFWLAPMPDGARTWYAPGYDPAYYSWDDDTVTDWAPLTVLHIGTIAERHTAALAVEAPSQ